MTQSDPRPTGPMLCAEVRTYCARVGCSQAQFSRASGITAQTLVSISLAARPLERTVRRVRDFIAAHPVSCPAAAVLPSAGTKPQPLPRARLDGAGALERARLASAEPARPSAAAIAAVEAEETMRVIKNVGLARAVHHALDADATLAERVATEVVETPGDLIARVRAAWPDLWAAVRDQARAHRLPPGAMLMQVIERGLEEMSA